MLEAFWGYVEVGYFILAGHSSPTHMSSCYFFCGDIGSVWHKGSFNKSLILPPNIQEQVKGLFVVIRFVQQLQQKPETATVQQLRKLASELLLKVEKEKTRKLANTARTARSNGIQREIW